MQTEFCPKGFGGEGVVAENFPGSILSGGGVVAEIFSAHDSVGGGSARMCSVNCSNTP